MGGTRLNRFMKGVEEVTGSIAESAMSTIVDPVDAEESPRSGDFDGDARVEQRGAADEASAAKVENPWSGLLQQGAALLQQLAAASTNGISAANREGQSFVQRDALTGESYLRIPMPEPEVLDQALRTLSTLLESLRR